MATYKNREVEIVSYDDNQEQSQVKIFNRDLNDNQIVNASELLLNDEEFNQYVVKRQEERVKDMKKQREVEKAEEQKRLQDEKKAVEAEKKADKASDLDKKIK